MTPDPSHLPKTTRARNGRPVHHWRRDLVELAALFTAVAVADAVANTVGHGPDGPMLLVCSAVGLVATAVFHVWWARRHGHAPPGADTGARPSAAAENAGPSESDAVAEAVGAATLWRMRTTVRDEPGALAALCAALAAHRVDILSLQTHPLAEGVVDEFLLRGPAGLTGAGITRSVAGAGGTGTWIERADAHDLVDAPTRVLSLATRTALDAAELPLALRQLLGRCTIRSLPAGAAACTGDMTPVEGALEDTVMRLRAPEGGVITVERPFPRSPRRSSRGPAPWSNWTRGSARGCRADRTCSPCPGATRSPCAGPTGPIWRRPGRCTNAARRTRSGCATTVRWATSTATSTTCSAPGSGARSRRGPRRAG